MTRSWVRYQSADPFGEAWERGRVRNLADPREIQRAIDAMPIGRPTFPAGGLREEWFLCIDSARADRLLSGERFDLHSVPLGWGFPVSKSRGVQVLPDAERELVIDAPHGICDGRRAYVYFGHVVALMDGEDLFRYCKISEARPVVGGAK